MEYREKICKVISSLDVNCSKEDVRRNLDALFMAAATTASSTSTWNFLVSEEEEEGEVSKITPLIVACDKGNSSVLKYFLSLIKKKRIRAISSPTHAICLIGSTLDKSGPENGNNTPMHHAAMAGCVFAIDVLMEIFLEENKHISLQLAAQTLGSARNANGDTPLQMAATMGHVGFMKRWYDLSTSSLLHSSLNNANASKAILEIKNDSGDTCTTMACTQGYEEIIDFLFDDCRCNIAYDEYTKCHQAMNYIDTVFKKRLKKSSNVQDRFQEKRNGVRRCLDKVAAKIAQQSQEAAIRLIELHEYDPEPSNGKQSKKSSPNVKKKKAKPKQNKPNKQESDSNGTHETNDETNTTLSPNDDTKNDTDDTVLVKTLQDGKMAVVVRGTRDESLEENNVLIPGPENPPPSAEELFRQRLKDNIKNNSPDSITKDNSNEEEDDNDDEKLERVVDALCLDVSMLMYTPHGMALNLSPSQLENVEQILEQQVRAVREAREIKERMHQTHLSPS